MALAFDNRLVNIAITIDGETITYDQNYYIIATGAKYTNGNFGECAIRLDNISKATRDFIISKTTPWNTPRSNAQIVLNAGRESYGTFEVFRGDMIAANVTQPPDIGLIFNSASSAAIIGYANAFSAPPSATLLYICQQVVNNLNMADPAKPYTLDFQSSQGSKPIGNLNFNGSVMNQINKLQTLANITAHIENNKLVILDVGTPRKTDVIEINQQTGMVGVPQITQVGIRVKTLILNNVLLGSPVKVTSTANPMANGNYYVFKLQYEIASRDTPFYWIMDLTPSNAALGYAQ